MENNSFPLTLAFYFPQCQGFHDTLNAEDIRNIVLIQPPAKLHIIQKKEEQTFNPKSFRTSPSHSAGILAETGPLMNKYRAITSRSQVTRTQKLQSNLIKTF